MILEELLGKPVWQMTGEELLFLAQHGNVSTNGEATNASSKEEKRYVYGLAGIARTSIEHWCNSPKISRAEHRLSNIE